MIQSSFLSAKVFMAHSLGNRATSQPFESRASAVPSESAGRASGASGSPSFGLSQRAMLQLACFEPGFRRVFAFEPVLQHLELQRPDRAKQRTDLRPASNQELELAGHALLQKLRQAIAEALVFRGALVVR
jgi:hypothetical protein